MIVLKSNELREGFFYSPRFFHNLIILTQKASVLYGRGISPRLVLTSAIKINP